MFIGLISANLSWCIALHLMKQTAVVLNGKQKEQHRRQRGKMVRDRSDLKLTQQPSGGGGS